MMNTIVERLAPAGTKCRPGYKRNGFAGVTIHNTGNTAKGAGAFNHASYLQGGGKEFQTSWHYVTDGMSVYRSIPEDEMAWHAGDGATGTGNSKTIAIEICVNPDSDLTAATDNAAYLTADILKRNGVSDVRSHVFQHNKWSGKNCPQWLREGKPYSWDTFIGKVEGYMNTATEKPPVSTPAPVYMTVNTRVLRLILNKSFNGRTATGGTVALMPKGSVVEFLEKGNDQWYKVKYNGQVGYASTEYLK